MSVTLTEEVQLWEHTWKVLELFVNQVQDARRKDADTARAFSALYQLARVCVDERWRQSGYVSKWKPPGPWEHEQAVANPRGWDGESDFVVYVTPAVALFKYLDEQNVLQTFTCPSLPDDPFWSASPSAPPTAAAWPDEGLFPVDAREDAAEAGDYDLDTAWWTLWQARLDEADEEIQDAPRPADGTAASDASAWYHPGTGIPSEMLNGPAAGCSRLAAILDTIADDVPDTSVCSPATARGMASAYRRLAAYYVDPTTKEGAPDRATLWMFASQVAPLAPGHVVTERLDELTGDRIGYPDGTLRALRAMESTLTWAWTAKIAWYGRRERRLRRVLDPFLDRIAAGLGGALAGQTGAGFLGALLPGRTATYASRKLVCSPASTAALRPGQLLAVDGRAAARGALTLVTGSETADGQTVVRTTALWLSIASSPTGISGLSAAGAPVSGAVTLSAAEVRRGWADDRARDGLILGFRALWTRLRLLRGGQVSGFVDDLLPTPAAVVTAPPRSAAWAATVSPRATTLVVPLTAGSSLVAPSGAAWDACFARPGEMLLLRGDAEGTAWQTAVEVVDIEVSTFAAWATGGETDFSCCDGPEIVIVTVLPVNLPVAVANPTLRRDFAGFGPRSLASGFLLPTVFDPDARSAVGRPPQAPTVVREAEMAAAARTLRQWLEMHA
ncbi:MAG: hypothetical protein V4850_08620 [Myxococcota bacterium]